MQIIRGAQIPFTPASHEDPADPGVLKRVLVSKNQLIEGTVQMVNWSRLPPGKSFRKHYHEDMQEVFVILDGPVQVQCGDATCNLDAGDAVLVDPMEIHSMTSLGDKDINYVVFGISANVGGKTVVCPSDSA